METNLSWYRTPLVVALDNAQKSQDIFELGDSLEGPHRFQETCKTGCRIRVDSEKCRPTETALSYPLTTSSAVSCSARIISW